MRKKRTPVKQYTHPEKKRPYNPPVGLVTSETDKEKPAKKYAYDPHIDPVLQFDSQRSKIERIIDEGLAADDLEQAKMALQKLKKHQEPYLNWAGKAEKTSFEVPTVSLHVHERIDPKTIIKTASKGSINGQISLFEHEKKPLRQAIEFYKHEDNWTNRLIAGDSLLVMNSLIEKEGMADKVQMIYIDPPYGISYKSNFQPFTNKRDVSDGDKDEDLTQEPESIKAFRDTWELGIHSYLTYIRDRLLLCKELLAETGCIFIQISDENLHHIREICDDVFRPENLIAVITFTKAQGPTQSKTIPKICDYLIQYAKDKTKFETKSRQLYRKKILGEPGTSEFRNVELADGTIRRITDEEYNDITLLPKGARVFATTPIVSQGYSQNNSQNIEVFYENRRYVLQCGNNRHWSVGIEGTKKLWEIGRLLRQEGLRIFKSYLDDFPYSPITNVWPEMRGETNMDYVVQTNRKVIERCLLMSTDPGDLVLDITCGAGTTAYVAEQWGRRWITCDTSRIAIALAKQRLMIENWDYYELLHLNEGIGSGFRYKSAEQIVKSTLAHNNPPKRVDLYDKPFIDRKIMRVTGPFTVEAVPAPVVKSLDEIENQCGASDSSVARSGVTLRQDEWRNELLRTGVRAKGGKIIHFTRVEPLSGTRFLQAEAETKENSPKRVLISFGPEHAPLEQRQVELALEEARNIKPKADIILFASFHFDEEAAKDIEETNWPGVTLIRVQMNTDLLTDDLKKKRSSNESFWLVGQPDVKLIKIKTGEDKGKVQVEVLGFDYYNPTTGNIEPGGKNNIAMWMLDPDYDGRSLYPDQVFFPMAGPKDGWDKLAKNLRAEIDEEKIEAFRGTLSLPFVPGKQIAVKIVDDRGIESLKIIRP